MMTSKKIGFSDIAFLMLCIYGLLMVVKYGVAFAAERPVIEAVHAETRGHEAGLDRTCIARRFDPPVSGGIAYFQDCADSPQLVSFRGGAFQMGDQLASGLSYEVPVHEVHVRAFSIGRYEVTIAQWQACVNAHGCESLMLKGQAEHSSYPVNKVTWNQAQDYVKWLSRRTGRVYRLPSEAEWEYAARAGSPNQYTWGNRSDSACLFANSFDQSGHRDQPLWTWQIECDDGFPQSAPVGSFPPNAWGLYDMLGNVWEWVQDCWHNDYSGAPNDGVAWTADGDCSKRVNRGGGWGNHPRALRVSNRDADPVGASSDGLGFRVARELTPQAQAKR